jgi:hypothetical protein
MRFAKALHLPLCAKSGHSRPARRMGQIDPKLPKPMDTQDMFPLHVRMTGSGTQFNMNVNEVISNRMSARYRSHARVPALRRSDVRTVRANRRDFPEIARHFRSLGAA